MKKPDIQQLLLEKGERIGLCVAGGLAFLLLVLTLFLPGKGLFSGTASGHSEELTKKVTDVKGRHAQAPVTESDKPPSLKDATAEFQVRTVDPDLFRAFALFFRPPTKDTKRRPPTILVPDEVKVAVIRGQYPALLVETDETTGKITRVMVMKGDANETNSSSGGGLKSQQISGQGFGNRQNNQRNSGNNMLRYSRRSGTTSKQGSETEFVSVSEIEGKKLATGALPARIAVIVASFPYKQQVDEFKRALGKSKAGDVLTKHVRADKETWNSFAFDGLEVERMVLSDDNPKWEPFDFETPYKQFVVLTNKSLEKDNPEYATILKASRKLVLRVPAQLPEDLKKPNTKGGSRKAPDVVAQLKNIKDTLTKLKEANAKDVVPPSSSLDSDKFSAYDVDAGTGTNKTNTSGGGFTPPPSDGDKYGSFQANNQAAEKIGNDTPLEHCLVRFVDTSLEGGKVYKYRFRVKMMNPNYSPVPKERKDTYPQFAKEKVLTSAGWAETDLVKVPPDQNVYALKMPEFGAKLNFEMRKEEPWRWTFYYPPRQESNQATVQIHRWVDSYYPDPTKSKDQRAVGEWLVAARILVERGEYVRDPAYKVPVPVKRPNLSEFELDTNPYAPPRQDKTLMPVDFGDETLLIDFEGGDQRFDKTESDGEKVKTVSVLDSTPVELLMMRPDGKMIARNSLVDMKDEKREKRAEAFTARIEKLRGHGTKTEADPLKANPK